MLMWSNANAKQIYQVKYKESKQQDEELGKITAKGKSGSGAKKRTKAVPRDAVGFARHLKI